MMKRFALMLMLLLPLVAGCLTDSGDDDEKNGGSGLTATSYMPMVNGATFTYTDTTTGVWYTMPDISSYTSTFSGPVTKNGKSYYRMIDDYGNDWPDTTFVRVANNTLYMIENFWDAVATKRANTIPYKPLLTFDDVNVEVEVPLIDFDAATWVIYSGTRANDYHVTDYNWTGKYLGRETVTVPAGTFNNAAMFEIIMIEDNTPADPEETWSYIMKMKMVMWFVADVGLVKSTFIESYADDGAEFEEESTTISVLNSYNIP